MIDPLTAILNRRAFMLEYERELSRCMREKTGLALAIFDLDHFKDVNDSYGHLVGDKVLRRVADTLRASLRGHDVIGRYGGEEFALLMPGADTAAALAGSRTRAPCRGRAADPGGDRLDSDYRQRGRCGCRVRRRGLGVFAAQRRCRAVRGQAQRQEQGGQRRRALPPARRIHCTIANRIANNNRRGNG